MDTIYVYSKTCPHCKKAVEIELKGDIDTKLTKQKDLFFGTSIIYSTKLREKRLVGKYKNFKKALFRKAKKGINYNKVKAIAEKKGIENEEDISLMLEILMRNGYLYQPKKNVYKVI